MQQPRIIIVDSAGASALPYARLVARLQPLEVRVETALDKALASLSRDSWDLGVVTARSGPTADVLYAALHKADPQLPMVVIDPKPSVDTARACLHAGAGDYLDVARVETDLEDALERLLKTSRRRAAEEVLRRAVERPYSFADFLGESPAMQHVYSIIERIATSSVDVLVTGETGTGKELVARAIHTRSRRAEGPFVPVDCGAIPDALIESELFGHERGAFTGADARRMGLVEFADGGTLFLDEVGELPLPLQAKLLRVLQERRVRRVGARQENPVDVRVVAATSRNVDQMVERGVVSRRWAIKQHTIEDPPVVAVDHVHQQGRFARANAAGEDHQKRRPRQPLVEGRDSGGTVVVVFVARRRPDAQNLEARHFACLYTRRTDGARTARGQCGVRE